MSQERDKQILRELAARYAQAAADEKNEERRNLHYGVNDLKPIRPVVLINEIPWNEFSQIKELQTQCEDEEYREAETFFRRILYQWEHFPCDMILTDYFPVQKIIRSTGIGLEVKEKIKETDAQNDIVSHEYIEQLESPEQLELLHPPVITYEKETTMRYADKMQEAFGDILPVKVDGQELHICPWDDIVRYRDFMNLLIDLMDDPEFMHATIRKMSDIYKDILRQYEEQNLLKADWLSVHCTSALCHDIPAEGFDPNHVRAKDVWGRGAAQIFSTVSEEMHDEFDITYMKELLEPFGLNYYGCCEPLHNKIHIVEKIPHLRKISISPWADVEVAAEIMGKKYVVGAKPNPSLLASEQLNEDAVRENLQKILTACRKNQCACDIVLKDISTIRYRPENLMRWAEIAMEMVR